MKVFSRPIWNLQQANCTKSLFLDEILILVEQRNCIKELPHSSAMSSQVQSFSVYERLVFSLTLKFQADTVSGILQSSVAIQHAYFNGFLRRGKSNSRQVKPKQELSQIHMLVRIGRPLTVKRKKMRRTIPRCMKLYKDLPLLYESKTVTQNRFDQCP